MLSTTYRLKLQEICKRIASQQPVELADRIWAQKLADANRSAATMLRQAQRRAQAPGMPEGGLDDFLNRLDIGWVGEDAQGVRRFNSPDEIANWFKREKRDDWQQRD